MIRVMSYDILAFTPSVVTDEQFLAWWEVQATWSEDHSYDDPAATTPELEAFYEELVRLFPPMNGTDAPTSVQLENDPDLESRLADYSIGSDLVFASFAWSAAETAKMIFIAAASKHRVAVALVSEDGSIIRPAGASDGKPRPNPVSRVGRWVCLVMAILLTGIAVIEFVGNEAVGWVLLVIAILAGVESTAMFLSVANATKQQPQHGRAQSVAPYLPTRVGFGALTELDRVDWSTLHHAYGHGVVGDDLSGDVARSLALLREDPVTALKDGLWSNVCHQGTVYEATAYALPFIAAVAAGDVPDDIRSGLAALLGDIAISGSHVAPGGSYAGSYGKGVDVLLRQTISRCDGYLEAIAQADRTFAPLVAAVRLLTTDPSEENRQVVGSIIDPDELLGKSQFR
jgi:hypothetical protein